MTGYNGGIDTIACVRATSIDSSDGDIIATGSGDGNIRIWIRREKDDETGMHCTLPLVAVVFEYSERSISHDLFAFPML
jgi:hypothetical protein